MSVDPRMPVELTEPIRSALRHCIEQLGKFSTFPILSARDEATAVLEMMDEHTAKVTASLIQAHEPLNIPPSPMIREKLEKMCEHDDGNVSVGGLYVQMKEALIEDVINTFKRKCKTFGMEFSEREDSVLIDLMRTVLNEKIPL